MICQEKLGCIQLRKKTNKKKEALINRKMNKKRYFVYFQVLRKIYAFVIAEIFFYKRFF